MVTPSLANSSARSCWSSEQAEALFSRLVKQLSEKEGVTEALKAENQMLWVQRMNNIRSAAMEIVANDLIYCLEDGYECQAGRLWGAGADKRLNTAAQELWRRNQRLDWLTRPSPVWHCWSNEAGAKEENPLWAGRNQSNLSVPYGVAKSRDTGEKTRRSGCHKWTADTVYPLKRKVAVTDGGFSFSGSIQEVIKFRE